MSEQLISERLVSVRAWRIRGDADEGCWMWFDPLTEQPLVRRLTADEAAATVDRYVSVSASEQAEQGDIFADDPGSDPEGEELPF